MLLASRIAIGTGGSSGTRPPDRSFGGDAVTGLSRDEPENDMLAAGAGAFAAALRCPTTLMRFSAAEGADGHCEMANRSLLNRRTLDWLDEQFGCGA